MIPTMDGRLEGSGRNHCGRPGAGEATVSQISIPPRRARSICSPPLLASLLPERTGGRHPPVHSLRFLCHLLQNGMAVVLPRSVTFGLAEIEQQRLGRLGGGERENSCFLGARPITG